MKAKAGSVSGAPQGTRLWPFGLPAGLTPLTIDPQFLDCPAHPKMLKTALQTQGGFSFENCQRNSSLERALPGLRVPHALKTGTTIAGLVFRDGVILGADTRATNDSVVADKNCEKIHFIAPKIYCCGAGVAADAEMTTRMVASNMELHALSTGREPRVATVTRMLRQTLFRCWGRAKRPWGGVVAGRAGLRRWDGGGRGCEVRVDRKRPA